MLPQKVTHLVLHEGVHAVGVRVLHHLAVVDGHVLIVDRELARTGVDPHTEDAPKLVAKVVVVELEVVVDVVFELSSTAVV